MSDDHENNHDDDRMRVMSDWGHRAQQHQLIKNIKTKVPYNTAHSWMSPSPLGFHHWGERARERERERSERQVEQKEREGPTLHYLWNER
jgi:hypothetical protein